MQLNKLFHKFFEAGVLIKSLDALFELVAGLFVLFIPKIAIFGAFASLTRTELIEDPTDKVIQFFSNSLQAFVSAKTFAAIYILLHGIVNVFLVIGLWRGKLWSYFATIGFILLFMSYQIYRIVSFHSLGLIPLTVFDLIFLFLTWFEYKHHAAKAV